MAVIYILLHEGKPVYVGQTTRHPVCRAWEHWSDAHYRKPRQGSKGFRENPDMVSWLRGLSEAPPVHVIEEVDDGLRFKAERYYINLLSGIPGISLLNFPPNDLTGYKHTDETREKMSRLATGRSLSEEHKARISAGVSASWARKNVKSS